MSWESVLVPSHTFSHKRNKKWFQLLACTSCKQAEGHMWILSGVTFIIIPIFCSSAVKTAWQRYSAYILPHISAFVYHSSQCSLGTTQSKPDLQRSHCSSNWKQHQLLFVLVWVDEQIQSSDWEMVFCDLQCILTPFHHEMTMQALSGSIWLCFQ